VDQVAYGYKQALEFIQQCDIKYLHHAKHLENPDAESLATVDNRFPHLAIEKYSVADLEWS
jgi:hypothetical protein